LQIELRIVDARDDHHALHLAVLVGAQERLVVLERDAAIGVAARPEQIGVREQAGAPEDRAFAADRDQSQCLDAVEQRLARDRS
jgi:hypothetical protein